MLGHGTSGGTIQHAVLSALATVLGLAGCEVGPDYKPPPAAVKDSYQAVTLPSTYPTAASQPATQASRIVAGTAPLVQWWTSFHDLELDQLIQRAAQSNLDLKQAGQRIRQARAQRAVVAGGEYPQVDLTGSAMQYRVSPNGIPIPISGVSGVGGASPLASGSAGASGGSSAGSTSPLSSILSEHTVAVYEIGFDASWELDVFGGTRRNVEAADADLAASVEDRRDVLVSLLAEVARNYIDLRGYQRELAITQENLDAQQQTWLLTQDRFKHGLATDLDACRAAAQVASTAAQLPTLINQQRQAIYALGVLLGRDPGALIAELSESKPIPPPPPDVPVGLPLDLLRRRPDIRRAERQLAAATARIGVATAQLYPQFSLTGSFGFQSTKPKSLLDWNSRTFSIGPAVDWPVFDAGRIRATIQVQTALQEQALTAYQKAVLTALQDVENALTAYSTEQVRRESLQAAVAADRTAVDLATQQYERGVTDFLAVLDAQRSLFGAQDQLAQSDRTISTNLVALYKAMGGGWEPQPATAPTMSNHAS